MGIPENTLVSEASFHDILAPFHVSICGCTNVVFMHPWPKISKLPKKQMTMIESSRKHPNPVMKHLHLLFAFCVLNHQCYSIWSHDRNSRNQHWMCFLCKELVHIGRAPPAVLDPVWSPSVWNSLSRDKKRRWYHSFEPTEEKRWQMWRSARKTLQSHHAICWRKRCILCTLVS